MPETDPTRKLVTLDSLAYTLQRIEARYQAKEAGKGLSANDFTDEYKSKVDAIVPEDTEIATDEEVRAIIDEIFGGSTAEAGDAEGETSGEGASLDADGDEAADDDL